MEKKKENLHRVECWRKCLPRKYNFRCLNISDIDRNENRAGESENYFPADGSGSNTIIARG